MSEDKKEYNRLAKQRERAKKKEKGIDPSFEFKKNSFLNNLTQAKDIDINLIDKYNITLDYLKQNYDNLHDKVKIYYNNKNNAINKPLLLNIYKPTLEELLNILDKENLADATKKSYISKINMVMNLINNDISKLKDYEYMIEILKSIGYDKNYMVPFLNIANNNSKIYNYIGHNNMTKYRLFIKDGVNDNIKINIEKTKTLNAIHWSNIFDIRNNFANEKPYSIEHLLISLYSYIPSMRDDFGGVHLLTEEEFHKNYTESDIENFYIIDKGLFIFNKYKFSIKRNFLINGKQQNDSDDSDNIEFDVDFEEQKKNNIIKTIKFYAPTVLKNIIDKSLEIFPRKYLITKNNGELYNKENLSTKVKKTFNININDIRHSFETALKNNIHKFDVDELYMIYKITGHSFNTALLYTRQSNNPIENIKDDKLLEETIINKDNIMDSICEKVNKFFIL